jgi:hypothetical protein
MVVGSVTIGRAVFDVVARHIAALTDVAWGWDCTMRYAYFTPVSSPCYVCVCMYTVRVQCRSAQCVFRLCSALIEVIMLYTTRCVSYYITISLYMMV